jgi:hypothetical protein
MNYHTRAAPKVYETGRGPALLRGFALLVGQGFEEGPFL